MKKYNTQKRKKNYKLLPRQKAFTTYSMSTFDDKEENVWKNNKIDTVTIKDTYKTIDLFNRIKDANNKSIKAFQNSCTFNEIIKCANIYDSNLG